MSYQFCLGPSGSGKSSQLHEYVIQRAQEALDHFDFQKNYMIVVPDQYTMETQKEMVLAAGDAGGIMNVDVLSFGRLSHRIFEEVGGDSRSSLDDMGKNLILRRLAGTCRKDLKVLGGQMDRLGMISEVKSAISEFMQYGISTEDVGRLSAYAAEHGQGGLSARLSDLQKLYEAFLMAHQGKFATGEETLDVLAEKIPQSELVKGSVIVFDGFTGFTPIQCRVLLALMQNARKVIFALDYGEDGGTPLADVLNGVPFETQDLFYLTRKTVNDIARMASRNGIEREPDWIVGGDGSVPARFRQNASLGHLSRTLFRYPVKAYAPGENEEKVHVHLAVCSNPEQEVRQMCIRIRRLMASEGYQYRDFGIVTGDLPSYEDAVRVMAARYAIPVTIDTNRAVLQNPLTETIRAALEISGGDWRYETVFRFLRSGLSGMAPDEIDRLENYCLARGIGSRRKWETAFDAAFEPMRVRLLRILRPLMNNMAEVPEKTGEIRGSLVSSGQEQTAEEGEQKRRRGNRNISAAARTKALYQFLVGIDAGGQMEMLSARYEAAGDTARAMEYGQIYGAVIHLLDELYELLGEEAVSAAEFRELVEAGFEEIRLGVLPQQVDRILVGDIERTRMPEVKVLFFLGVNDGNVPKGTSRGGLISDLDREFLQESDVLRDSGGELAPTPRQQMYIQRLYLYMNMTRPSEELYVSYCRTAGDGTSLRPSYLTGILQQMFPSLSEEIPEEEPLTEQMVCAADTASFLSVGLRDYADGMYLHAAEQADPDLSEQLLTFETVYGYCVQRAPQDDGRMTARALRDAAFLRYQPAPVSKETARRLYGRVISGSVTRLEAAAQCYLKQFLQYGLRLTEREEYVLAPNDSGTILHESVQRFGQILQNEGVGWKEYSKEQGQEYVRRALREAAGSYNDQILYATERSSYQAGRLERILARTVDTLQYQLEQGDFLPAALEQSFGEHGELTIPLPDGAEVQLYGRIDRVDLAEADPGAGNPCRMYVKIVDYKSGNRDLDPKMMKAGIQMQLLLYLLSEERILQKQFPDREIVPAAMLYYHFDDPMLGSSDADKVLTEAGSGTDAAERMETSIVRKKLRPKGMVGADPEIIHRLDRNFTSGSSEVIPVKLLKNGSFGAGSRVFDSEELRGMEKNLLEKIREIAGNILAGRDDANPAVLKGDITACTWCPFRNVCGFDRRLPGCVYREIR